ncbi:MAG TPA: hypothetical protein ENN03_06970 [bacterium]|nr:hypothetical protein [bacterium]
MLPAQKQRYCPTCSSDRIAEILYGPLEAKASKDEMEQGGVVYGGAIVREEGPHWMCRECKTAWCRRNLRLYVRDEFGEFIRKSG